MEPCQKHPNEDLRQRRIPTLARTRGAKDNAHIKSPNVLRLCNAMLINAQLGPIGRICVSLSTNRFPFLSNCARETSRSSEEPRKQAVQRCSVARAHSLHARLLVLSCISRYPMPEKPVPRSAMARQCRSLLLLVLAEVEAVEAVQAVQRCFESARFAMSQPPGQLPPNARRR